MAVQGFRFIESLIFDYYYSTMGGQNQLRYVNKHLHDMRVIYTFADFVGIVGYLPYSLVCEFSPLSCDCVGSALGSMRGNNLRR